MSYFKTLKGVPDYKAGLGYSPASGPAVGMPVVGPGHFFQYNVSDLLPRQNSFGRNPNYNSIAFPGLGGFKNEVGPGNTPGGQGGVNGPWLYTVPLPYWNYFGKKKNRKSRKKPKKKSRKNRKKPNKSRKRKSRKK